MIFFAIYIFTFSIVLAIKGYIKNKVYPLPELKFEEGRICFDSIKRHKIHVGFCSCLVVNKDVFLKRGGKTIKFENVASSCLKNGYFIFTGLGKVTIEINNKKWYKYLQMNISSNDFDLTDFKRQAELEIINNLFNISDCHQFARYIRIVKKILNINFTLDKLQIKQNKYKLKFCLEYVSKDVKKRLIVN